MTQRLIGLILGAGTGLLLGGQLVIAADRIDLFDTHSNRTGYIIVDRKTGRFDTYDTQSKRTGWGTITRESGDVQVYDKDGNRVGSGIVPAQRTKR
jgi:sugar lactone lactonase YvrE